MRLAWTHSAVDDIEQLLSFIAAEDVAAAASVARGIKRMVAHIQDFPAIGRVDAGTGRREWVVRGLPVIVVDSPAQRFRRHHRALSHIAGPANEATSGLRIAAYDGLCQSTGVASGRPDASYANGTPRRCDLGETTTSSLGFGNPPRTLARGLAALGAERVRSERPTVHDLREVLPIL